MTALAEVMGGAVSAQRYAALAPAVAQCLQQSQATTVDRIAMWAAQIGHESGGLKWMEELADGWAYEGRVDLGNTQPGDGPRFKGRGPIQVTGRHNYTVLSRWAFDQQMVDSPTFFVDQPEQLASERYGFMGATWYWLTQRPLNEAADQGDIVWATKLINGGTNGLEDRRQRYQRALGMGSRLLQLLEGGEMPTYGERRLDYDRSIVPQETGWNCGPASAQVVLNGAGVIVSESTLASDMHTHTGGTDTIDLVAGALKKHAPQAKWATTWMPNDPPNAAQRDALWSSLVSSINSGWGLVLNWVAPPGNHPKPIPPSDPALGPNYGGSTVWHYVAAMGYDDGPTRKVWIADSGFKPFGYWVSFDQCATLIPPKGYAYSTLVGAEPPPPVEKPPVEPPPVQPPPDRPDADEIGAIYREVTQWLAGRTLDDATLVEAITAPRRSDTMLGHSVNAAALSRVNYELLIRIAEKLGVDVTGIR